MAFALAYFFSVGVAMPVSELTPTTVARICFCASHTKKSFEINLKN